MVEVLPRRTLLARANLRGDSEAIVANVTQLVVVVAPLPQPDYFIVDRYLCAATAAGLQRHHRGQQVRSGTLTVSTRRSSRHTQRAGYAHIPCSAKSGSGISQLEGVLANAVSVLVGQSGVGKSSLVNALLPEAEVQTGELMREEEGRHTTTASRAYELKRGGTLIDSPGVRDFAPAIDQLDARTLGFPEVDRLAAGCRFQDCRHMQEPDCALIAAVESGEVHGAALRKLSAAASPVFRSRRGSRTRLAQSTILTSHGRVASSADQGGAGSQ